MFSFLRRSLAITATVAVIATTGLTVAHSEPTPDTAALASDPAAPGDLAIAYPGTAPGAPAVTLAGDNVVLANSVIRAELSLADNDVAVTRVLDVATEAELGLTTTTGPSFVVGGETLALRDGTRVTAPAAADVAADPGSAKLAERHPGKAVTAAWVLTPATGAALRVEWRALLREGSNYVQQTWTVTPASGATAEFTTATLVEAATTDAHYRGRDAGYPVTFGDEGVETAWLGVENPIVDTEVTDTTTTISIKRSKPVAADAPVSYTTGIGIAPAGQLRRAFTYYLERERPAARRPFLHYQSWYDLQPNPDGLNIDPEKLSTAIDIFGGEMQERDAVVDSYWVDDGWDYLRDPAVADETALTVWDFDPTYYPTGFAPQMEVAESHGGSLSVWMSPFGGYGTSSQRRAELNRSKPADEQLDMYSGNAFKLAGEKYYTHFRDTAFDMIDNHGVRGFKFDGIGGGLFQTGPNETYRGDYENLLRLTEEMREHQPDVWINATVGMYGSPYWMWYVDSIWRDGHDARMTGQGTGQQQYVNYRDGQTYQNIVEEASLVPITTLMNHGFVFSNTTFGQVVDSNDLSDPAVRKKVADDLRNYYAMGMGLQEMYVKHSIVDPAAIGEEDADWFWDTMAYNAIWARDNTALLTDAHWIGGDPAANEIYGTAAWSATSGTDEAMVMLRNPTQYRHSFPLELGRDLELPDGAATRYRLVERDGQTTDLVAEAGAVTHVVLEPFQVLLFEGSPTTDPVTPSEEVLIDPSLLPMAGTCWAVTASSQETVAENGAAANAFDGNAGSIWHTQYSGTVGAYPHVLTADMGQVNDIDRVGYLARSGGDNGKIKDYVLQGSLDGTEWTDLASGTFTASTAEQVIEIPTEHQEMRFLRLRALNSINGASFAAVAELNVYGEPGEQASRYLDRDGWTATASSEQTSGEDGAARNAIDCRRTTYWHTAYSPEIVEPPHHLTVDLGSMATVSGFNYLGRTAPANGIVADYGIEVSTDGETWAEVASGTWTTSSPDDVTFDEVEARYVRLVVESAQNGRAYGSAAEINVIGSYIELETPDTLVTNDRPGTGEDTYTIPDTASVVYLVNGNVKAPGTHTVPEGSTLVVVTATAADGYRLAPGAVTEWQLEFSLAGEPTVEPTEEPTVEPTEEPTVEPTEEPTPTAPPTSEPGEPAEFIRQVPYTTPGIHTFNGRQWITTCEPYSQTERCRTEIWASTVKRSGNVYTIERGWAFNNLTYLPFMTRSQWATNPLGYSGSWTGTDGSLWRTECDTAATGRNGCRTYRMTTVYHAAPLPDGGYSFGQSDRWVFNNMVLFGNHAR